MPRTIRFASFFVLVMSYNMSFNHDSVTSLDWELSFLVRLRISHTLFYNLLLKLATKINESGQTHIKNENMCDKLDYDNSLQCEMKP
jgi:hypothetical protein